MGFKTHGICLIPKNPISLKTPSDLKSSLSLALSPNPHLKPVFLHRNSRSLPRCSSLLPPPLFLIAATLTAYCCRCFLSLQLPPLVAAAAAAAAQRRCYYSTSPPLLLNFVAILYCFYHDGSEAIITKLSALLSCLLMLALPNFILVLVEKTTNVARIKNNGDQTTFSYMENFDDSESEPVLAAVSSSELKTIISRLSMKRPHLILSILKSILETIEVSELNKVGDAGFIVSSGLGHSFRKF